MNSLQEGKLLGRWHDMAGRTGVLIVELNDLAAVHRWIGQWNPYLDVDLTPVVDDEELAAIGLQIVAITTPERRRAHMQAHYTRLFTDESGASRFEDLTIELQQMFSPPGLETSIFSAPFLASEGSLWIGALNTWNDESLHQAPRRMI